MRQVGEVERCYAGRGARTRGADWLGEGTGGDNNRGQSPVPLQSVPSNELWKAESPFVYNNIAQLAPW